MDTVDRNYVESAIENARRKTATARHVANSFELWEVMERLTWALDFLNAAQDKLPSNGGNPDGTTGPEHVTDEGVELGPPKG